MTVKILRNVFSDSCARAGAAVLLVLLGICFFLFPVFAEEGETLWSIVALGLLAALFAFLMLWMVRKLRHTGLKGTVWQRHSTILIHCSLWVVLVGGLITYFTRHEAILILTEGQNVDMQKNPYLAVQRRGVFGSLSRPFNLRLRKHSIRTAPDKPFLITDVASDVEVSEGGRVCRQETIRVNRPLRHRGLAFLLENSDFSPHFVVRDSRTGTAFNGFVNIKSRGRRILDYFRIPEMNLTVRTKIYPDYHEKDGKPATRGLIPNNPAAYVELVRGEEVIYSGVIAEGSTANVGTLSISFEGLKWWTRLNVRSDPGVPVIYAGFMLGLVGLVLRYIRPKELPWRYWVRGVVDERGALQPAGDCYVKS